MHVERQKFGSIGVSVHNFDASRASGEIIEKIKGLIYSEKIVVLKEQRLDPVEFIALGQLLGEIEAYYEPMYHHPDHKEIFVSSNVPQDGVKMGVPQTGKFWHADYSFMPRPFGITMIYPQVVPKKNRGTYFIDMGRAYARLSDELKSRVAGKRTQHSPRRYFKIRPEDVYRPVSALLAEIEEKTPAVNHPLTFTHPATGETILYISDGFTELIEGAQGETVDDALLHELLEGSGQRDSTFKHENIHLQNFEESDILLWDNRSLVHRALHTTEPEPTASYRLTMHDQYEFFGHVS
ncbi:(3R)-3-[(carboxymethyl)amino]fatty acid oxygenase/decarboxylase [Streptosporangium sp. NPDC002607]